VCTNLILPTNAHGKYIHSVVYIYIYIYIFIYLPYAFVGVKFMTRFTVYII
jgi:hypothetical protein